MAGSVGHRQPRAEDIPAEGPKSDSDLQLERLDRALDGKLMIVVNSDLPFPARDDVAGFGARRQSRGGLAMPLQRGEVLGYDFNRMVVDFTMFNQGKTVRCAISTAAMDDLEGKPDVRADQRVDQFVRLRDAIEERASRKFFEGPVEAKGPVVLRSNDFFK